MCSVWAHSFCLPPWGVVNFTFQCAAQLETFTSETSGAHQSRGQSGNQQSENKHSPESLEICSFPLIFGHSSLVAKPWQRGTSTFITAGFHISSAAIWADALLVGIKAALEISCAMLFVRSTRDLPHFRNEMSPAICQHKVLASRDQTNHS